jgi:hypothetical protein
LVRGTGFDLKPLPLEGVVTDFYDSKTTPNPEAMPTVTEVAEHLNWGLDDGDTCSAYGSVEACGEALLQDVRLAKGKMLVVT